MSKIQVIALNDDNHSKCYVTRGSYYHDMADFAKFNEVYAKYFIGKPARSCVAVKDLPKGALVEVEVIASLK